MQSARVFHPRSLGVCRVDRWDINHISCHRKCSGRFNPFHKCEHLIAGTSDRANGVLGPTREHLLATSSPLLDGHVIHSANTPWEEPATLFLKLINDVSPKKLQWSHESAGCAAMLDILPPKNYWQNIQGSCRVPDLSDFFPLPVRSNSYLPNLPNLDSAAAWY